MHHPNSRWLNHTQMTYFTAPMVELPKEAAALTRVVQGLLFHGAWLDRYGVDVGAFGAVSRTTLPVEERLAALFTLEDRNLVQGRPIRQRQIGTCRDFALMMCAFLRAKGTAARLRCGFASYLREGWEDHWVCEYWDDNAACWHLADAQLDDVVGATCNVTFDPADVPRDAFLTAGEAWSRCRAGGDDPDRYGHGDAQGVWFMGVNVVRDALAVNHRETSDWDGWREAKPGQRTVSQQELPLLDELARAPEVDPGRMTPAWLAGID